MECVRSAGMKRGKRENDKGHHLFNRGAEEQTADQWVLLQKSQLKVGGIVDRRGRAGDKEVQQDTQNIGTYASIESLPPEQAGGNPKRNVPPSEQDAGLSKIQGPG